MARDTSTLRDILFDELDGLRNGTSDQKRAAAVAKLASQIISTAKVEMDYHKLSMRARAMGEELLLGSMDLGARVEHAEGKSASQTITHESDESPKP